jgi:hypothetical protein
MATQDQIVPKNRQMLTPDESAIYGRIMNDTHEWDKIQVTDVEDFSLAEDPFKLPPPAVKLRDSKEFAFRWVTRSAARLDEIKSKPEIFRWWPVNRVSPRADIFDPYIDPNTGCVPREDQMLMFKPYWLFLKEQEYYAKMADAYNTVDEIDKSDGGIDIKGGKRKVNDSKSMRQEVKGSDIQFKGEAETDIEEGRSVASVSEEDLNSE